MTRRTLVEECLVLDVFSFAREGHLTPGAKGSSHWRREGEELGAIEWWVDADELHLLYPAGGSLGRNAPYHDVVLLERSAAAVGKERIWFACPACGERAAKLYYPLGGSQFFLCRRCHGLSYKSRQERLPGWARDWKRLSTLYEEESRVDIDSPRSYRLGRQAGKLERSLERAGFYEWQRRVAAQVERAAILPPRPKRGPGRPSKKEKRAEAQAERAAIEAARVKRPRGRPRVKRSYTRHTPLLLTERKSDMEAYCVKCRDRREMKDPTLVTLPNDRPALQGTCTLCQTKVTRIVKASEVEALKASLACS